MVLSAHLGWPFSSAFFSCSAFVLLLLLTRPRQFTPLAMGTVTGTGTLVIQPGAVVQLDYRSNNISFLIDTFGAHACSALCSCA